MNSTVIANPDSSIIYEGGGVFTINAEDLHSNIVGIRQLINSHNMVAIDNKNKSAAIVALTSEVEYLKTSPFIAGVSAILNIIGSLLLALGVNFVSSEPNPSAKYITIIVCGGAIILVASLMNIFYPFVRKIFITKTVSNIVSAIP